MWPVSSKSQRAHYFTLFRLCSSNNTTVVYASLTPIYFFAIISFALVCWSHYYDRPRGLPANTECDPTEW